jgi:hypothetical protein
MRPRQAIRTAMCALFLAMLLASAWGVVPGPVKDPDSYTSRWEEGRPGCTFSRDVDGKYRYGFWTDDFGIVLAVDSQELEKVRRRAQPLFAVQLTVHYRGTGFLDVAPGKITLEFVKHYQDVHSALDPDDLSRKQRNDADSLAGETKWEIRKHPEKRDEKEAALAARQKDVAEMIEFLRTRSLRAARLNPGHPEVSGWVLFGAKSKWIDGLQKQEEFVLRVPMQGRVVEFPFSLPTSEGDLILRQRPGN